MMRGLIQDILNDPREYMPFLLIVAGMAFIWTALCVSGIVSLRASSPRHKFWLGLIPAVFGLIGVWAEIPFSMERDGFRVSFDLGWLFMAPLLLGGGGLVLLWRMKHGHARLAND